MRRSWRWLPASLTLVAAVALGQPASEPPPSIASSLGGVGNLGGFRDQLDAKGISFNLTYTGEVLATVSGGVSRGAIRNAVVVGLRSAVRY